MEPIIDYWKKFKSNFADELLKIENPKYTQAWQRSRNRTHFYENVLIPAIANKMNLVFKKEDFKINYTLNKKIKKTSFHSYTSNPKM